MRTFHLKLILTFYASNQPFSPFLNSFLNIQYFISLVLKSQIQIILKLNFFLLNYSKFHLNIILFLIDPLTKQILSN